MHKAEQIAKGLTKAQRAAMTIPYLLVIDGFPSVPLLDWPESMVIYEWQDYAALSPIGKEVRALLLKEQAQKAIQSLSQGAKAMLLSAISDGYAGTYVGNGGAIDELHGAGLCDEPKDYGGNWGRVARLNDIGLAARYILEEARND